MNEIAPAPENSIFPARSNNLFNSRYILFIPLFFVLSTTIKKTSVSGNPFGDIVNKLPNLLDFENLGEKIEILKKIGPYLPETTIGTVNTIIVSLDRINRVIGLMDVISSNNVQKPISAVKNLSNKERFSHILTTIKEELPEDKIKNVKPILDLALNFDKYKTIINMMSTLGSTNSASNKLDMQNNQTSQNNQDNQSNKNMQLEKMLDSIKPMLGEDADKSMSKIKEMMQMFEILNVINTPDKEKSEK